MDKEKINELYFINIISSKGGVGKTTLGLALANYLTKEKGPVLYLDLDFTGTNLETGFRDDALIYDKEGKEKKYLNNLITDPPFEPESFQEEKLIQYIRKFNFDSLDGKGLTDDEFANPYDLYIAPSKTGNKDIDALEPFLTGTSYYPYPIHKVCKLIDWMRYYILKKHRERRGNESYLSRLYIIFDNSPGAFGLSRELLKFDFGSFHKKSNILSNMEKHRKINLFICSTDRQDIKATFNDIEASIDMKIVGPNSEYGYNDGMIVINRVKKRRVTFEKIGEIFEISKIKDIGNNLGVKDADDIKTWIACAKERDAKMIFRLDELANAFDRLPTFDIKDSMIEILEGRFLGRVFKVLPI